MGCVISLNSFVDNTIELRKFKKHNQKQRNNQNFTAETKEWFLCLKLCSGLEGVGCIIAIAIYRL